jgi:diacylglycerol kinase family enzyme
LGAFGKVEGARRHNKGAQTKGAETLRCLIVHNDRSGFGSSGIFEFERALIEGGDECVFRSLAPEQAAASAVADAEDFDLVVLSGGDGTTTSLLYALRNRDVTCCVFPSGTANLFCSNLGVALEPAAMATACRVGRTARTDLGEVSFVDQKGTTHVHGFSIMMGTGFDAQLIAAAIDGKRMLGEAAYFAAALANARPKIHDFRITVDGVVYERRGISCLVANNSTIQGDVRIVPDGSMADGLLDVIVLGQTDVVGLLKPIVASIVDPEGARPNIETFRGASIRVETAEPAPLEYDGETFDGLVDSYEAHVIPGANRVVVDRLSPYASPDDPYNEAHPRFDKSGVLLYPAPPLDLATISSAHQKRD